MPDYSKRLVTDGHKFVRDIADRPGQDEGRNSQASRGKMVAQADTLKGGDDERRHGHIATVGRNETRV